MTTGRNAVATLIEGGEAEEMARYSLPLMERYAEFCGAELLVLRGCTKGCTPAHYGKLQIADWLSEYERILFIDADILISRKAPDVFERVDHQALGVVSVENVHPRAGDEKNIANAVLGEINWTRPYFNSGVMLASRCHKELFRNAAEVVPAWTEGKKALRLRAHNDQTLLNYLVNSLAMEVHDLGKSFNYTSAWGRFHERFRHYFIHYAGLRGNRAWQMKRDYGILHSGTLFGVLSACPSLAWLWDRAAPVSLRGRLTGSSI